MKKCGVVIESLSAVGVLNKLSAAGISVLGAEKIQKNAITVWVDGKDCKKVFAILRGSCYNIKEVKSRGVERVRRWCIKSAGLLVGAALFLLLVCGFQNRILRVEVTGSGAYYSAQVMDILEEGGAKTFSASPAENAQIKASILALPRVSFCSLRFDGGVLKVVVEVSDENALSSSSPLLSPATGQVTELTLVRGRACVQVGDSVEQGALIVDASMEDGRSVLVMARVTVRYFVQQEYALNEREALAQAELDYGVLQECVTSPTENGILIEGYATATSSVNL
ncbi:MAG: sporulation protein YqfD [Clostridia bacterium]|nr:sporulation protein YqfD [Clostridia bacterium]